MDLSLNVEQKSNLGRLAAKLFLRITDNWQLTDDQRRILAGAATRTTISTWRKRVNTKKVLQLGADTYERISYIKAIDDSIRYRSDLEVAEIIRKPQDHFNGYSLLDKMLNGRVIDLYDCKVTMEQSEAPTSVFSEQSNGHSEHRIAHKNPAPRIV